MARAVERAVAGRRRGADVPERLRAGPGRGPARGLGGDVARARCGGSQRPRRAGGRDQRSGAATQRGTVPAGWPGGVRRRRVDVARDAGPPRRAGAATKPGAGRVQIEPSASVDGSPASRGAELGRAVGVAPVGVLGRAHEQREVPRRQRLADQPARLDRERLQVARARRPGRRARTAGPPRRRRARPGRWRARAAARAGPSSGTGTAPRGRAPRHPARAGRRRPSRAKLPCARDEPAGARLLVLLDQAEVELEHVAVGRVAPVGDDPVRAVERAVARQHDRLGRLPRRHALPAPHRARASGRAATAAARRAAAADPAPRPAPGRARSRAASSPRRLHRARRPAVRTADRVRQRQRAPVHAAEHLDAS